jgi:hypothetical protein
MRLYSSRGSSGSLYVRGPWPGPVGFSFCQKSLGHLRARSRRCPRASFSFIASCAMVRGTVGVGCLLGGLFTVTVTTGERHFSATPPTVVSARATRRYVVCRVGCVREKVGATSNRSAARRRLSVTTVNFVALLSSTLRWPSLTAFGAVRLSLPCATPAWLHKISPVLMRMPRPGRAAAECSKRTERAAPTRCHRLRPAAPRRASCPPQVC